MQVKLGKDHFMVIGGATRNAEIKEMGNSGKKKVSFSLGLGENEKGEKIYANCDAFGKLVGYASTIEKGNIVAAIGTISQYTSQNTGKTYNTLNVEWMNICRDFNFNQPMHEVPTYEAQESIEEAFGEVSEDEEGLPF